MKKKLLFLTCFLFTVCFLVEGANFGLVYADDCIYCCGNARCGKTDRECSDPGDPSTCKPKCVIDPDISSQGCFFDPAGWVCGTYACADCLYQSSCGTPPPKPSTTPSPSTSPPPDNPSCDSNCGTCGWRDSDGVCHDNEATPNGTWCCHRVCQGSACVTVSGTGTNQCDTNENCCHPSSCELLADDKSGFECGGPAILTWKKDGAASLNLERSSAQHHAGNYSTRATYQGISTYYTAYARAPELPSGKQAHFYGFYKVTFKEGNPSLKVSVAHHQETGGGGWLGERFSLLSTSPSDEWKRFDLVSPFIAGGVNYLTIAFVHSGDSADDKLIYYFDDLCLKYEDCEAPPAAPTLTSPSNGPCQNTSVALEWNEVDFGNCCSGQTNGYLVYLDDDMGFGDDGKLNGTFTTSTQYSVSGLSPNTVYYWKVVATNGCSSLDQSSPVSSFTTAPSAPDAPTNLSCNPHFSSCATPTHNPYIHLSWTAGGNEAGFEIYHRLNEDLSFSPIATRSADTTAYDHGVGCNRDVHRYQVRSYEEICGQFSSFSSECSAQCADALPDKATDLFPNGGHYSDNENITLFWSNLADNQWGLNCEGNDNRYFVYYCKAGDGCSATSVSNINECTSQDGVVDTDASPLTFSCTITNSLEWGSTYYWKVVTSNGELTNEAFGSFNTGYPSAWWQTETGDVYGKGGIVSPIWRDVAENQRYFSLINDSFGAHSGLVASLNANDNDFSGDVTGDNAKGEGQATETDFYSSHHQALAADFSRLLNDYSFAKLASLVDLAIKDDGPGSYNSGVKVITVADASSIERNDLIGNDPSHPQPAPDNLYYYPPYGTGDMAVSIDSPFSVGANEKFVIFVDDDLNINQSITVAPGGFLAFIVKEDITIAPGVTQVQGVYFADGSLIVESSDATDEQFKGQGIFVAKEGASLKRNFRNARNAEEPTEVFTFDPSYLFTAPKVFREKPYLWREVVP